MQCCIEVIKRPCRVDHTVGIRRRERARVGQRRACGLERLELLDALFIGNCQQDDVATLLGASDLKNLDPRAGCGERAGVGIGPERNLQVRRVHRQCVRKKPVARGPWPMPARKTPRAKETAVPSSLWQSPSMEPTSTGSGDGSVCANAPAHRPAKIPAAISAFIMISFTAPTRRPPSLRPPHYPCVATTTHKTVARAAARQLPSSAWRGAAINVFTKSAMVTKRNSNGM